MPCARGSDGVASSPSHPTLVAYGALFVALGGVSYAAISIPANAIGPAQLKTAAVGAAELKKGAVGADELKQGAVQLGADPERLRPRRRSAPGSSER